MKTHFNFNLKAELSSGFSLLEALVAFSLIAVACYFAAQMLIGNRNQQVRNTNRRKAQLVAESVTDVVSSLNETDLNTLLTNVVPVGNVFTLKSTGSTTSETWLKKWSQISGIAQGGATPGIQIAIDFKDPATLATVAPLSIATNLWYLYIREFTATINFQRSNGAPIETYSWTKSIQPFRKPTVTWISMGALNTVSGQSACAVLDDSSAKCWNSNLMNDKDVNMPMPSVNMGDNLMSPGGLTAPIAIGLAHACALYDNGSVKCWGDNTYAQLGQDKALVLNSSVALSVPLPVSDITSIAVANQFSCALSTSKGGYCWGVGANGATNSQIPTLVANLQAGTKQLAAGGDNVIALTSANSVISLSTGNLTATPTAISLGSGVTATFIAAGTSNVVSPGTPKPHFCAITNSANVECWGTDNSHYQLGNGSTTASASAGVYVQTAAAANLANVTSISLGDDHSCAFRSATKDIWCWGSNSSGQLGTATVQPAYAVQVTGFAAGVTPKGVYAGFNSTCATLSDGTVSCWGMTGGMPSGGSVFYAPTVSSCF